MGDRANQGQLSLFRTKKPNLQNDQGRDFAFPPVLDRSAIITPNFVSFLVPMAIVPQLHLGVLNPLGVFQN